MDTTATTTDIRSRLGRRVYWLARSEGFRVDTPAGRLGIVELVMLRARPDDPDALVVRVGVLGRRLVVVPVDEVADVLPRRQRVMLRRVPDLSGSDFLSEVRGRLRRLAADGTAPALGLRSAPLAD
jgi:hypothetical protein